MLGIAAPFTVSSPHGCLPVAAGLVLTCGVVALPILVQGLGFGRRIKWGVRP